MKKIDDGLKAFENYKANYESYIDFDLSESDTRSKLIDTLLIDVLGWDEKDIIREEHIESGYYDYKLSVTGINILIEAKKKFKEFSLPSNHNKVSIKSLLKGMKK